jgi:F-type H+-transporting ATPase subunit b
VTQSAVSSLRYLRRLSAIVLAVWLVAVPATAVFAGAAAPQESHAGAAESGAEAGHGSWKPTIYKLINFVLLVGLLVYFLRAPVGDYFRTRGETVRRELVEAATLRSEAERQLSDVRSQLAALPAELEDLRRRGEDEVVNEKARIKTATEKVREQLLERTRRDIEFQFRQARRQLLAHTADLAVSLARTRIERVITVEDQKRLIDRYAVEVRS